VRQALEAAVGDEEHSTQVNPIPHAHSILRHAAAHTVTAAEEGYLCGGGALIVLAGRASAFSSSFIAATS
jgi:hypothetical protein